MVDRRLSVFLVFWVLSACGKDASPAPAEEADATRQEDPAEKEREAAIARRRAEREAKEAAAAKAEAEKKAAIDAVAVLPKKLPKRLKDACEAVVKANDAFMKKHYADDPKTLARWEQAKGTQLGMTRQQCIKEGSIEVAACQAHALSEAPSILKKSFAEILLACKEKFGTDGKAP